MTDRKEVKYEKRVKGKKWNKRGIKGERGREMKNGYRRKEKEE